MCVIWNSVVRVVVIPTGAELASVLLPISVIRHGVIPQGKSTHTLKASAEERTVMYHLFRRDQFF